MLAPLVLQPRTLTLWVHWVLSDGASAGLAHPRRGNHVVAGMILRRRSRGAVVKRLLGFQALRSGMAGIHASGAKATAMSCAPARAKVKFRMIVLPV
jgi:hypothetical protein